MSGIIDNLNNKIEELACIRNYISELESKLADVKETSILQNIEFVEVENDKKPIFKLYTPVFRFTAKNKCNKCDCNGFIHVENDFFNEYKLCECQYDNTLYEPFELDVFEERTSDDGTVFVVYSNGVQQLVNAQFVKEYFEPDDFNMYCVYYKKLEECEEYCNSKNAEYLNNDK